MANVTKPIALNETFKTTGNSPKNIADVLEDNGADLITQATAIVTQLQALINAVKPSAGDIPLAPITGMNADDVQEGISELKGTLGCNIKSNTMNLTTNNSGSAVLTNTGTRFVIGVHLNSSTNSYTFRLGQSSNVTYLHLMDEQGNAVTNATVNVTYLYIDFA